MNTRATQHELAVNGRSVPLVVRRHKQARRLALRLDAGGEHLVLTLPPGVPEAEGLRFARRHTGWAASCLARQAPRVPFADGAEVPFMGTPHTIRHDPGARGGVWAADGVITVAGRAEHVQRRVTDWLREQARREGRRRADAVADRLGAHVARVSIRDTRSRWGSCSSKGNLNLCWRLIMAPEWVFQYVVVHEVAHLREPNHSARFWRVVRDLGGDPEPARAWLNQHGRELHRYGPAP